jgi:hypothetical protein
MQARARQGAGGWVRRSTAQGRGGRCTKEARSAQQHCTQARARQLASSQRCRAEQAVKQLAGNVHRLLVEGVCLRGAACRSPHLTAALMSDVAVYR